MPSLFDAPVFNERLFYPMPDEAPPPAGARDLEVAVPGGRIQVRLFSAPSVACTLLLFPGNGEKPSDYDDMAGRYAEAGARLAVAGYRGYGRSLGEPTLRRALADAEAAFEALAAEVEGPIVVLGRSLGSSCAAQLAARAHPRLAGLVWECGFVDLYALIGRRGMAIPAQLPEPDLADFDPARKLALCPLPLLVFHGTEDSVIDPAEAALALRASGADQKQLVRIQGGGHNDLLGRTEYWRALELFLAGVVSPVR